MTAMKGWRKKRILTALPREEGTVSVEAVILLPLLVLIVLGILEFGHLWHVRHTLTIASREGARAAAVYYVKKDGIDEPDRATWAEQTARDTVNTYLSRFWAANTWALPQVTFLSPEGEPLSGSVPENLTGYLLKVHVETSDSLLALHKLTGNLTVWSEATMRFE
jgi:hypothetical protein